MTGQPPFRAPTTLEVARQHLEADVPPLPQSLPRGLADAITRALRKDPRVRPDAAELRALLSPAALLPPTQPLPATEPAHVSGELVCEPGPQRRAPVGLAFVAGVATAVAVSVMLPHIEQAPKPEAMPPAGERDRPFIDWRSTPAARVCLPAETQGRFRLMDALDIFATAYLPSAPRLRWLPPGRTRGLAKAGVPSRYFVASDGPVDFMAESPYAQPPIPPPIPEDPDAPLPETDRAIEAAKTWEPLPSMMSSEPALSARAERPMTFTLPVSMGIAAVGGATASNVAGVDEAETWLHVDVLGRVGRGRHNLLLEDAQLVRPREPPAPGLLRDFDVDPGRRGQRVGRGVLALDWLLFHRLQHSRPGR